LRADRRLHVSPLSAHAEDLNVTTRRLSLLDAESQWRFF
jgi:hypothetical protein